MHFLIYHRGVRVTGQTWPTTHNKSPGGLYQLPFRKWIQWPTVMWISFAHDFAGRQPCVYVRANCRFWNWIQVWKQCQNGHVTMEWHGVTRQSWVTGVRKSRGNRVFFNGDLSVHARKLLTLHRSNPTRSFRQLSGRRFFTLSKTSTGRRWNEEGRLGRFRTQISRRSRSHKLIFFVFLVFFKKPGSVESVNIKTRIWRKWMASGLNIYGDWEKNLGKLILKILWRLSLTSIHFYSFF